jgi:hypothetical protein
LIAVRYYVAALDETAPHYLGHAMKFWSTVYNWAEAGYAINRPALDRLFTKFKNKVFFKKEKNFKKTRVLEYLV